ncbi:FecR family protein [Flavobacterium notoginsengisoli]|uniref:FecR family protein n=1 Tax=Flavobacterium notoginsengisoli TaxID=1478199 RepID=UPI003634A761
MNQEEKKFNLLVLSYIDRTMTADELKQLEVHLAADPIFEKQFVKSVQNYRIYRQLKASETVDPDTAWEITKSKFSIPFENKELPKAKKKRYLSFYSAAAAVTVLLCSGYFIKVYVIGTKSLESLKIPKQEITLILPGGEVQQLNTKENKNVTSKNGEVIGRQNGAAAYFSQNGKADKLQYNTLKIPYGKQFNVTLSDGTKVYLNAGTSLRFPQYFSENLALREVEVDGEAYFEVAKNKKQPFVVHSSKIEVTVLGTQFNFRTYPEEKKAEVVLKEGSVRLQSMENNLVILKPGDMGYFIDGSKTLQTKEVFVANYIAWINGELIYRNVTFGTILKSLERHFNVKIENHSDVLKDDRLNVNFGNESLPKVLAYLKDDFGIDYTIKNNTIILK